MRKTYRWFEYHVRCDDCGWSLSAKNALGAAAQHADKHQHTVRVDVEGSVTYTQEGSAYMQKWLKLHGKKDTP